MIVYTSVQHPCGSGMCWFGASCIILLHTRREYNAIIFHTFILGDVVVGGAGAGAAVLWQPQT